MTTAVLTESADCRAAAELVERVVGNAWATDPAGRFVYVTPALLSALGITLEELNSVPARGHFGWRRVIHPDDYDRAAAAWRHCLLTGDHYNVEHRMLQASGAFGWGRSSGQPLRDDDGRITGWYGTVIDADVRSVIEKNLSEAADPRREEKAMPDAPRALGLIHPDDRTESAHAAARAFWTGVPQVTRHRQLQPDGSYRWIETRSEPGYSASIDIDDLVTEREPPATPRLSVGQRSEAVDAAMVVESIFGNGWAFDAGGRWVYLHPFALNSLGVTLDELNAPLDEGHTAWKRLLHPEDYDQIAATWRHCLATGDHFNVEFRFRRASGAYVWARTAARPARDDQGRITGWFGIALDIDVHRKTVAALRGRERELSQLVDLVPSHLWRLTPEGEPTFFNGRMVDFLGFDVEDTVRPGMTRLAAMIEMCIHPDDARHFGETLGRCLRSGDRFSMRYRLRRADGVYRWMSSGAEALRDGEGRILQWYGLCHDIDDQIRLYSDLEEREARIRRLVDSDIIGIVIWDLDGRLIDANSAFLRMIQYEREDLKAGLRWFDMTPPEWQDAHARYEAEELLTTGKMQPREKEFFRKDGSRVPVLIGAACFEGQSRQGVAYILDLTDRKQAEATVRDRERELAQLVDTVPVQIWCVTPGGEPAYINKTMMDYIGLKLEDFDAEGGLPSAIRTIVHPDDRDALLDALRHSFTTGERFELRFRNRRWDGEYRWTEGHAEPLRDQTGRIIRWYGANVDIQDFVEAQEALRASKRQLEQMIDAVPVNLLSFAPSGRLTYASKRYLEQAGSPAPHIEDFDALARDVAHSEDFPVMFRRAREGFATGQPFVNRFRRRLKDGGYRWIEARAQPLRDADGAIVQWYIASIDIEEEMNAQQALRERERTLRQLVETLPAMIDCAAPNGEPIYRSRQLREFLGYDLEELDGTGKSRLAGTLDGGVHPDDLAGVRELYAHSLSTGEPYARRHRLRRADGEYRWVETRAAPMRDREGGIVQWNVICLDIENEVRAQEELRLARERLARASQAASLAELSASIAHEVNQPLAAIVANSHACHRWLSCDPPNVERAKNTAEFIVHDANSAADVVNRIRALFRQSADRRSGTALGSVIAEVRDLLADEAAQHRIRLDVRLEDDLPIVSLDRVQIQQVLINLMRNGIDAMASVSGNRVLRISASNLGDAIRTEISDRGPGLEFPDRMFEPFFTTKEQGMGMGLSICRSIVEAHGGRLWAENNEPGGATLVFTLPLEVKETP